MSKEIVPKLVADFVVRNTENIIDAGIAGGAIVGRNLIRTAVGLETAGPEASFIATLTVGAAVKATRRVLDKVSTRRGDQK